MIISVFGPRTTFVSWVLLLIEGWLTEAFGCCTVTAVNTVEELRDRWSGTECAARLIYCDRPIAAMSDLMVKAKVRKLLISDPPDQVVFEMAHSQGIDLRSSLRSEIARLCSFHEFSKQKDVNIVINGQNPCSLREFFNTIIGKNVEVLSDEVLYRVIEFAASGHKIELDDYIDDAFARLSKNCNKFDISSRERLELIDLMLPEYSSIVQGREINTIRWPAQIFYGYDVFHSENVSKVDLTGKARHLVYGPYLHLPPGKWRANIQFSIDEVRSGCALVVDVVGESILAIGEVPKLPERGAYEMALDFDVENPLERLEVRIYMKFGSIEGLFMFGGIELKRRQ